MRWPDVGSAARAASGAVVAAALATPATVALPPPSAAATPATAPAASASAPAAASTPLRVELDDVAPAVMPRRGRITVTGTVSNADSETWTDLNLYTFLDDAPIDDTAELAEAARAAEEEPVGDRITDAGTEASVGRLEPGERAPFRLRVPARLLLERVGAGGTAEPGVYWFGVHVLGTDQTGRDEFTDARARTFLPLLPESGPPVRTALVVPLRAPVSFEPDGSLAGLAGWRDRLSMGGRLRDRVDFGAASGAAPVSWLVDPGLLDVVERLAGGNQPRSLAPTVPPPGQDGGGPSGGGPDDPSSPPGPDDGGSSGSSGSSGSGGSGGSGGSSGSSGSAPSGPASAAGQPSQPPPTTAAPDLGSSALSPGDLADLDPETREAAERAAAWIDRFGSQARGDELLTLPYGDLDVSAALQHEPDLYDDARARGSRLLRRLSSTPGTTTTPVVASPSGFVDPEALPELPSGALVLGTDRMVEGRTATVVRVGDRRVVLASSGAADGGPGPTPRLSTLALRQRVLAEAALRQVDAGPLGPDPLVVVMPDRWQASRASTFFDGLASSPGLRLSTLAAVLEESGPGDPGAGTDPSTDPGSDPGSDPARDPDTENDLRVEVSTRDLVYPPRQQRLELGERLFDAAGSLRRAGTSLQGLLARNDQVGTTVGGESLMLASYAARRDRGQARTDLRSSRQWIDRRLGAVDIAGPRGVTLSGTGGAFSATVDNRLDQPVEVEVRALSDAGIAVSAPSPVSLAARGRATVLLSADRAAPGVHNVTLRLTDVDGRALPSADVVPIRSAQVSNVIWLILGTGVGLLFAAIALRTWRRVRAVRAARGPG